MPSALIAEERVFPFRWIRCPGSLLKMGTWYVLEVLGGLRIACADGNLLQASSMRLAHATLDSRRRASRHLHEVARRWLPLVRSLTGEPWPAWWHSPAPAVSLARAADALTTVKS